MLYVTFTTQNTTRQPRLICYIYRVRVMSRPRGPRYPVPQAYVYVILLKTKFFIFVVSVLNFSVRNHCAV